MVVKSFTIYIETFTLAPLTFFLYTTITKYTNFMKIIPEKRYEYYVDSRRLERI